jgi:hypothetical protein
MEMDQSEQWRALAPPPAPLAAGCKWHVFLSYRSTERKWVLALYDILTQLKYQVFMDQFVLVAGEGLASSLGENLEASQSGILVWSTRSEDSAWCRDEYNAFKARQASGDFRFVAVRLQDVSLPALTQGALWIDASGERDGLRGTSLLRLLYGLQGKALPSEAVRLAERIDDTTNRDLANIRSCTGARDSEGIVRLAQQRADEPAWRTSPVLPCAAAQALISVGAPGEALELLEGVRAAFPAAIRPRQLTGLALARSGRWKDAKAILGELYELGERDPETVGIYARTWMNAYEATGDRLMLRRSRDLYAEGFAKTPSDFYPGINAAAKSIFLDEIDAGIRLARDVEQLVGTQPKAGDYWHSATVAEAQLIQGHFDLAATRYEQAVAMAPGAVDDHRSTCKQARLLLRHLNATPEQLARVLGVFRREVHAVDAQAAIEAVRTQGRAQVVTFVGFSGAGYEDEAGVRAWLREQLKTFDPSRTLVCAGATPEGIGMVYAIALKNGFRTAGIVSSQARTQGVGFSTECELVVEVDDATWGGKQGNGRLSPTSQAMAGACDVMIGIGGGAIARDELEEARRMGKPVRFFKADMNHALATDKASAQDKEPPGDFGGEAQSLFVGKSA